MPNSRSITVPPERKRIPIDLPDDFGTGDAADRRVVLWLAATLVAVLIVAAIVLSVVTP